MELLMRNSHIKIGRLFILSCAVLMLLSRSVFCDDKDMEEKKARAKIHFENGKALVEKGEYEKAIAELKASYELVSNPIVLYNIAVSYDELYKYAEAVKYYTLFLKEEKGKHKDLDKEVSKRIKELDKYIGFLHVDVDVAGAEVFIDDISVGNTPLGALPVENGEHSLVVRKDGYIDLKNKFPIVSGETTVLSFTMETQKTTGKAAQSSGPVKEQESIKKTGKERKKLNHVYFWSVLGLTVAAGITAITTGSLAIQKNNEVGNYYSNERDKWEPLRDEGKRLALATDIMIAVTGAAAVGTLVIFFFTDFKKGKEKRLSFAALAGNRSIMMGFEKRF
jgi:hypothetical protein